MNKTFRIILTCVLSLLLIFLVYLLVMKNINASNEHVKIMFKEKSNELNYDIDISKIVNEIPLLDYVLEYDSFNIDKELNRVVLNYKLKEGKKLTDIYYDNVKYNSEMIFALIKDLKEVRLSVTFINDANEEETVTYSNFRDDNSTFNFQDSKKEFSEKYEDVIYKLVKE